MTPKFTERAIAYLKGTEFESDPGAVVLPDQDMPVLRPVAKGLAVAYLVDSGGDYRYVQNRHLQEDGISAEEVHLIGLRNLQTLTSQRDLRVQPYGNIFAVLMGGDFEASLILLDEIWEHHFQQFVPGRYAIAIPARDVLAFCDSESNEAVAELKVLIKRVSAGGDHLVSERIYLRQDGQWQPSLV